MATTLPVNTETAMNCVPGHVVASSRFDIFHRFEFFWSARKKPYSNHTVNFREQAITLIDPAVRGRYCGLQRHASFVAFLSNPGVKKK
jgi:hypothetical protein